ncbi:acyl-CoA synthetase FdrA [Blastococcus sp. BMG 814]|uniref:Acyl-CoA synthetase FdrA n=1 Tax=Blastococcus carthaginiensis TaxID=3050034 RepID=A0ABT9I8P5_9ACTN|nr:acyl-CoA synthetase FdrA [Blastococcus carthaginiensis]MDP5181943.1 acyl-CoA synthetase FdrA [Blastococcus carthaginiensis]
MTAQQNQIDHHRVYPNLYKDSVALMAISAALLKLAGVAAASVVMATDSNRENLRTAGLADDAVAGPNDLLVAVRGDAAACEEALDLADRLLAEQPTAADGGGSVQEQPPTSVQAAATRTPSANLALVSVPGPYAAAEALKALRLGLDVMLFSDNVPVEHEIEIKRYAAAHQRLVMGPDCGTALVNGIPLGFANVVRRGRIGVVGASGTGMQEITCRIHQHGQGVSQALGTGGHDLSADVGGISMLHALQALGEDEATDVVVLVSKPPASEVATAVLDRARSLSKPVVVVFVGADTPVPAGDGLHPATTLADASDVAVGLLGSAPAQPGDGALPEDLQARLRDAAGRLVAGQRYVRGVYSGGTFCYEAQLLCRVDGVRAHSNTPIAGNPVLEDIWSSREHTIIDMGDDAFTRGRPHPMIDPTLRNERLLAEAQDPATAVLLFDVVLGYGAATDPVSGLLEVLDRCRSTAEEAGRVLPVIAHVCGTDEDPQHRPTVVAALQEAGVLVADSNAHAARMAGFLATQAAAAHLAESGKK